MSWKRWCRPEAQPLEGGLLGYRQEFLGFLSFYAFFASWMLLLAVLVKRSPTLADLGVLGLGLGLSAATLVLRHSWPRLTCRLYVVVSLAWVAAAFLALRDPALLSFLAVPVLLAALLVSNPLAVGLSLCAVLLLLSLSVGNARLVESSPYQLALIVAAAGVGIVTNRGLRLIDLWEREVTRQQSQLIVQLRERQGELNRVLKALDEAYEGLKRSHDELAEARQQADEARALKEQFVANVSHELCTPLNLITGFAEIMYLNPETYDGVRWTPELENDIREMNRAARHLQSLVDDILDLSRIDASRLPLLRELLDIRVVVTEAAETIRPLVRQRGLSLDVELPDTLPALFIDRTRIRQVLLNLLNNAVRFTDHGGISVELAESDRRVIVSVRDTGTGIPADQLDRIFEGFHRADAGPRGRSGTGLGLSVSRQFVELHGGRMWPESKLGEGSTFYFSLPLPGATPETVPLQHVPYRKQAQRSDLPVVEVDPDPSTADMLSRYLGDRPVLTARGDLEAEMLVESDHPAALIVNQRLDAPAEAWLGPLGALSARYAVPVLRCAIPTPLWLQQNRDLDDCLTKPVSREMLSRTLAACAQPPRAVMIVDDDAGFVSLMERLLSALGYGGETIKAYSGPQALRLARERTPDLILLDLLMPEVSGYEVARQVRADPLLRGTCIVAVTATSYGEESLQHREGYFTLSQSAGVSTGTLTELLNAVLGIVHPNYVERESSRE